jgi:hypothetical protein
VSGRRECIYSVRWHLPVFCVEECAAERGGVPYEPSPAGNGSLQQKEDMLPNLEKSQG